MSSKKCLNGGGGAGSGSAAAAAAASYNGHSQTAYHYSFPTSPSAPGGRKIAEKMRDGGKALGRAAADDHHQDPNNNPAVFPGASDHLAHLWDPLAQLSLRASLLKGTTLLPYLNSGAKFEQMLQEMLHRDLKKDAKTERDVGGSGGVEGAHNGGGPDRKPSPSAAAPGEGERGVLGVMCRWCSQVFPNVAVLLQHERYLCKVTREAAEVPDVLLAKDRPSPPPLHLSRSDGGNGRSPQQVLVAMHSPPPHRHHHHHQDALRSPPYWPSQEKGSPGQLALRSPEASSPHPTARRRASSSELGSPVCLDLTSCPPDLSPRKKAGGSWSQSEPLDLSLPKHLSDKEEKVRAMNGSSKREAGAPRRPSPAPHLPFHHAVYGAAGAPVFPGPVYNGFPIFNQPANNAFLPPMAYMMEADTEAALKKMHQERQALMVSSLLFLGELEKKDFYLKHVQCSQSHEKPGKVLGFANAIFKARNTH